MKDKQSSTSQVEDKHTPGPWHKHDPNKEGSYICRMRNGYIKMCHWDALKWTDMWETTLDGEIKEWMYIPGDELPIDPNARLMAAAPELLDLLSECLEQLEALHYLYEGEFSERIEAADKAAVKAWKLIAKIEGNE